MFDWKKLPKELQSYIPDFKIQLFELKPQAKEFETENLALYLFLRLIQIIREKGEIFEGELLRLLILLSKEKQEAKRVEILLEMLKYLLSTRKDAEKYRNKDFYKLLEAEYMTVLDKILEEGELKGIEKGKIETARNMRLEGIEVSVIVKVTGLTQEQLKENGVL
jgi:predicted transposase/invertase (TIGR01784 family)